MANFNTRIWDNERIFMVDFSRAKTGAAHKDFPDVDDLGHSDDSQGSEHGAICCSVDDARNVQVRFHRTEISLNAPLHIVSTNPALVTLATPASGVLSAVRSQIIKFNTAAGASGRAALEVRYKWADGPVIGRLYVQVNQRVNVRLRFHLVTINGHGHSNNFLGHSRTTVAAKHTAMQKLFDDVNHFWLPYGVFFSLDGGIFDEAWTNAELGTNSVNPTDDQLIQGGAMSPNRSATHVNIYFVPQFQAAATMAFAWPISLATLNNDFYPTTVPLANRHLGNGIFVRTDNNIATQSLAHELGHYLNLCMIANPGPSAFHSMADTLDPANSDPKIRDDQGTRRRLMYPYTTLVQATVRTWRNDTGYGNLTSGGFVNVRHLSQDVTSGEVDRARNTTTAGLYHT